MNKHRRVTPRATSAPTAMLVGLAVAALAWGSAGCTAMIEGELASKKGPAGGSGGGGAGGAGGDTGGATTSGQLTTTLTTTSESPCPQGCVLPHATSVCEAGGCVIVHCEQGFADCDETSFDGCEAWLFQDDMNCGKCHHACQVDEGDSCKEGKCK